MNRTAFTQLLKKYVDGNANNEEAALIDSWYKMLYSSNVEALNADELANVEQEMWDRISEGTQFAMPHVATRKHSAWRTIVKYTSAAAIFVGVSIGIYYTLTMQHKAETYQQGKAQHKLTEVVNDGTLTKQITLQDCTVVILQPLATLAYPTNFSADKREVFLEGEAFFNVAKNAAKPFLVHSGNLVTQVLGTSFTIKPNDKNNQIEVSVKTGKVAVFEDYKQVVLSKENKQNNGTIITPNQKVVYDAIHRNFKTLLVDNPQPVAPHEDSVLVAPSFAFDDEVLLNVLESIGEFYAIDIIVENENINQCRFTGNINSQTLYDKLSLICQTTNHEYEIKGTKILIKGKGCN